MDETVFAERQNRLRVARLETRMIVSLGVVVVFSIARIAPLATPYWSR